MHKMVWNTILIWLFAFGVLAGITFLALIGFKDMLAVVIVLGLFYLLHVRFAALKPHTGKQILLPHCLLGQQLVCLYCFS